MGIPSLEFRRGRTSISEGDVRPVTEATTQPIEFEELERQAAMDWASKVIDPLLSLRANWDSYGAVPLDISVARMGKGLLASLAIQKVASPQAIPTADGGLSLEWHRPELDFVISLAPPHEDPSTAYFRTATEHWEIDIFGDGSSRIGDALAALMERDRPGS